MMLISTIYVVLRLVRFGTSVRVRTVPDAFLRTAPYCAVGAGWRLGLHVVEIVVEFVIWDKFVFNELTSLVDNRVGVHSHWRLGSC